MGHQNAFRRAQMSPPTHMQQSGRVSARLLITAFCLAPACGRSADSPDLDERVRAALSNTGPAVTTQHNDVARSGANLSETLLNTTTVTSTTFGKVASHVVRGAMYAQPLYLPNVSIPNVGIRNVVYVATMHNYVYAFDADNGSLAPYWRRALEPSIPLPDAVLGGGPGYRDIWAEVGIVSTPVISTAANAIYVVAATKSGSTYTHQLHKLSLTSGADLVPSATIQDPGTSPQFRSDHQLQRASLLLTNNVLYIAFASYGDNGPYTGWLFAYSAAANALASLTYISSMTTTSNNGWGGIWMAGQGPAADSSSNVYFATGNGAFTAGSDYGDSVVKASLGTNNTLAVKSWFSPADNQTLNSADGDLGSAGVTLVPGTGLAVQGGKEGIFYLLNQSALGGQAFTPVADFQIPQKFFVNTDRCPSDQLGGTGGNICHHIHGSPVWWNGPKGLLMYVWPENDYARAFHFNTTTQRFDCGLNCSCGQRIGSYNCGSTSTSTTTDPDGVPGGTSLSMPGGMLSISANGSTAGSGILWASHPYTGNGNQSLVSGILRAYDASDLTKEQWNSRMNLARDDVGVFAKYASPTISGGQVFMPTFAGMSAKQTLTETSNFAPALAHLAGSALVVGWTGTDGRLNVLSSSDGVSFANKNTLSLSSITEPALASGDTAVYLAWAGTDTRLNVIKSSTASFSSYTQVSQSYSTGNQVPLLEQSDVGPALANANGRIFIAWKGNGNTALNVMSSTDGVTFDSATKITIWTEATTMAPSLYYANSLLYLGWVSTDGHMNIMTSSDNGLTFGNKVTLGSTSAARFAMVGLSSGVGTGTDVHFLWPAAGATHNLAAATADNGQAASTTSQVTFFNDASNLGLAASSWQGKDFFVWTGLDSQLNFARYSPGELAVYGRL